MNVGGGARIGKASLGMLLALLGLAACAPASTEAPASELSAAEATPIDWQARHPLTWADFRGSVPDARNRDAAMSRLFSDTSLTWRSSHEAAETVSAITAAKTRYTYTCSSQSEGGASTCTLSSVNLDPIHAQFDPATSWVIQQDESPGLLRHEQGHFDITAIFAGKLDGNLRAALNSQLGKQLGNASTRAQAEAEVKDQMDAVVRQVNDPVIDNFRAEQDRYDIETNHGTDPAGQSRWSAQILDQLRLADG